MNDFFVEIAKFDGVSHHLIMERSQCIDLAFKKNNVNIELRANNLILANNLSSGTALVYQKMCSIYHKDAVFYLSSEDNKKIFQLRNRQKLPNDYASNLSCQYLVTANNSVGFALEGTEQAYKLFQQVKNNMFQAGIGHFLTNYSYYLPLNMGILLPQEQDKE